MTAPKFNLDVAMQFLDWHSLQGRWVLTAIPADKKNKRGTKTETFRPADGERLGLWLENLNSDSAQHNI